MSPEDRSAAAAAAAAAVKAKVKVSRSLPQTHKMQLMVFLLGRGE